MKKIKQKIDELLKLIQGTAPKNEHQREFYSIKRLIGQAATEAAKTERNRIKKGGPNLAALLNEAYNEQVIREIKEEKNEPKKKKGRGRPKKEKENLLATSATPKTLVDKLKS